MAFSCPPGEHGELLHLIGADGQGGARRTACLALAAGRWIRPIVEFPKDAIISGRTNIHPREVEEGLLTHPSVQATAVIGLPCTEWGEEVEACIVSAPGITLEADALDDLGRSKSARFKRRRKHMALPEAPKNSYGKDMKTALPGTFADGQPDEETT